MSSTQAPAPQAPHTPAMPSPTHMTEPSTANARPTTANNNTPTAQDTTIHGPTTTARTAPTTAPATTPNNAGLNATSQITATDEPVTFNDKLNAGDRYWKFKFALKAILIITGLIGIGCFAWIITTIPAGGWFYGYDSYWSLWPSLITWAISIVWCTICIVVFVVRKRPAHPGLRVALDLLLWLGFIVTALFAVVALLEITNWGNYGDIDGYSSSAGNYVLESNNTWVWEQDTSYISSPRDCNRTTSRYYYTDDLPQFATCADQDAYVNKLWQEKPHRVNVELTGVVCQFFGLVLHFALFVWACIDCHRYNRSKVSKDAEKLAAGIVQTMIQNGAVVPPPGQAYMRPPMGQQGMYYQLPPQRQQAYPMTAMHPQSAPGQFLHMTPAQYAPGPGVGVAGPSNEKSAGARYA